MKDYGYSDEKILQTDKKWFQLKQKQQIIISTMLRDLYIKFVLENKRKPNRDEKQFIAASVYLDVQEKEIFISANEISKYFESRIVKYDKSIEKLDLMP